MSKKFAIKWLEEPQHDDYSAAASYLSLLYDERDVAKSVKRLRKTSVSKFQAKDVFRASGLPMLGIGNSHVARARKKIVARQSLAPLLLVRTVGNLNVCIADGYHRMCAVYSLDEDAILPCKIV